MVSAGVSHTMSCWIAGEFDRHRRPAFSRATASSRTSSFLQNAKPDDRRTGGLVVVEDHGRHGDDAGALGQREAEVDAVGFAERPDVAAGEVGALGDDDLEPRLGQAGTEAVALGSHLGRVAVIEVVAETKTDRDRVLERRTAHEGEELLGRAHRGHEFGRPAGPADLPAGEREDLAGRRDRQRPFGHPRQGRERDVLTVEHEVLVDLVGDGDHVVLAAQLGDQRQLLAGEDLAGGVVRRVEQQDLRVRGERGPKLVGVEGPIRRPEGHDPAGCPAECDPRGIRVVVRLEGDDLVAGPGQREHRGGEGLGRAGGDQHLAVGVEVLPPEPAAVVGHRLAQRGNARQRRVLIVAVADRLHGGLGHLGRAVGVGEPLTEVDGVRLDRQGRHLREDRGSEPLETFGEEAVRHGRNPTASASGECPSHNPHILLTESPGSAHDRLTRGCDRVHPRGTPTPTSGEPHEEVPCRHCDRGDDPRRCRGPAQRCSRR